MTGPVRVLAVDHSSVFGGSQMVLLQTRARLLRHGCELVLATPADNDFAVAWRAAGGEHVIVETPPVVGIRNADDRLRPGLALTEARRAVQRVRALATAARTARVDVVLSNSHWSHLDVVAAARRLRRPSALYLHDRSIPGLGAALRGALVKASGVTVAVSHSVADSLPAWSRGDVVVLPNGVDLQRFQPPAFIADRVSDAPTVLVVGRVTPEKGQLDVVHALAAAPAGSALAGCRLLLAGPQTDAAYAIEIRAAAAALRPGAVELLGDRTDVPDLLKAADLLVLATRWREGMPLAILEAHACALPVVAYDDEAVKELLVDGENGLLVATGDEAALRVAMERLLADRALARRFGDAGRARVEERYDIEAQAATLAATLIGLVGRQSVPTAELSPAQS